MPTRLMFCCKVPMVSIMTLRNAWLRNCTLTRMLAVLSVVACVASLAHAQPQTTSGSPQTSTSTKTKTGQKTAGSAISDARFKSLDPVLNEAVAKDEIPGAVLLVSSHG